MLATLVVNFVQLDTVSADTTNMFVYVAFCFVATLCLTREVFGTTYQYCGPKSQPIIPPLSSSGYKLIQVQTFIRHGDRTLCTAAPCWPNDDAVFAT